MIEFLQSAAGSVVLVVGAILALAALAQGGNKLYRWLKVKRQGYLYEDEIEAALLPFLYQAIMAAYKGSEALMDAVGERLRGTDKARIARLVYQALPDTVSLAGAGWQWKKFVGEEKFVGWLQVRFNDFVGWWDLAEEGILKAILPADTLPAGTG